MSKQTKRDSGLTSKLILTSKILSILISLIGLTVIIGWIFDIGYLVRILPHFVSMKANSAFGFILTGLTLLLLQEPFSQNPTRMIIAKLLALNIFFIGFFTLLEHLLQLDLHIDQLVFQQISNFPSPYPPGQMAPVTAVVFIFTGIALLAIDIKQQVITQFCGYMIGLFAVFVFIGVFYTFQTEHHLVPFAFAAIHDTVNFVLISITLFLIRPNEGIMVLLTNSDKPGQLFRLFAPLIIVLSGAAGYFILMGLANQLYDHESGTALLVTVIIAIFIPVAAFISTKFMQSNIAWKKKLQAALTETDDLYNFAPCGYHSLNPKGVFIRINQTESNWLGYSHEELIDKIKFSDLLTPTSLSIFQNSLPKLLEVGYIANLELELIRKDNSTFIVLMTSKIVRDINGKFLLNQSTLVNIDERKRLQKALAEKRENAGSEKH